MPGRVNGTGSLENQDDPIERVGEILLGRHDRDTPVASDARAGNGRVVRPRRPAESPIAPASHRRQGPQSVPRSAGGFFRMIRPSSVLTVISVPGAMPAV